MIDAAEVIEHHKEKMDIIPGPDGFYVFWPERILGAMGAPHLRVIADELDRLNAPWEKQINEYFDSSGD